MNKFATYYLQPNHWLYQFLTLLNQYRISVYFGVIIILISYPVGTIIYQQYQFSELEKNLSIQTQQLAQTEKYYQSRLQYQQNLALTDQHLTAINQQIQQVLHQQNATIESIQWNVEEQSIQLSAQLTAPQAFTVLNQLNQNDALFFKTVQLQKLDYQRLLQLTATLFIQRQNQGKNGE